LPFQVFSGSQTSNRIAGFVTPTTLQNAGRFAMGVSALGGVKAPAGTVVADEMTVSARCSFTRLSHDVGLVSSANIGATNTSSVSMGRTLPIATRRR
jgi:hypothetical protein